MRNIKEISDAPREQELICLVKDGSQQAFSELVSLYQKQVFKMAFGFFQNRDDAMEIVQETFLRVYEKIDRFDQSSSFKSWLYRIAYNLCIDFYRKFKSKKDYSRDVYEMDDAHHTGSGDPEGEVDRDNFKQSLQEALQYLSKRQKMIFVMKHYNSLKYREIAAILDISLGTVKSLHHRAARALRKRLAHYEVTR